MFFFIKNFIVYIYISINKTLQLTRILPSRTNTERE